MQQRFGTLLAVAVAALALSACGGQQPAADATSAPAVAAQTTASTSAPAPATSSPSSEPPLRVPASGLPSAQFCEAGEKYLVKFPDLPRVQPPAGGTTVAEAKICAYTSVIGDTSAPMATLAALPLTGDSDELAKIKGICETGSVAPGATKIDAEWVLSRGWSGWTATRDGAQQAMLCADGHVFSSALVNVPGSTPDDALNTILGAIA